MSLVCAHYRVTQGHSELLVLCKGGRAMLRKESIQNPQVPSRRLYHVIVLKEQIDHQTKWNQLREK